MTLERFARLAPGFLGCLLLLGSPAADAATRLTIKAGTRVVDYGDTTKIAGRLESGARGVRIVLVADRFPFDAFHRAATAKTRKGGRYSFKVKPKLATKYRVRLASKPARSSRVATVYVDDNARLVSCSFCGGRAAPRGPGHYTFRVTYIVRYPPSIDYPARRWYHYWGVRKGSKTRPPRRVKFLKTSHAKRLGPGREKLTFSHRYRAPRGAYSFRWTACTRSSYAHDGFGVPGHHHCGDRAIRYPAYLKYLG